MANRKKVKVRFPNEYFFDEIELNMDEFRPEKEFNDQIFGWYGDIYISIEKDSLEE